MISTRTSGLIIIIDVEIPEITADNSRKLTSETIDAIDGRDAVVLNLAKVDHLDSSGLSYLITMLKRVSEEDGSLALCNVGPRIQTLLKMVRMTQVFSIYASEEEAIAAVEG